LPQDDANKPLRRRAIETATQDFRAKIFGRPVESMLTALSIQRDRVAALLFWRQGSSAI